MKKIKVAIIYGGKSSEHEVSKMSARNIIDTVSKEKYDVIEIFISQQGGWFIHEEPIDPFVAVSKCDVVFPVLHGQNGEDGSMQGLLQLANFAYVGAGILGSAVSMDKDVTKRLCREAGIPVAPGIVVRKGDTIDMEKIESDFGYPMFIKATRMGSSVGVYKVENRNELVCGIADAFLYDTKILVEQGIQGQEVETAILGNENPRVSLPGIIRSKGHRFYTYESKYLDDTGYELEIPAQLPNDIIARVQDIALQVFQVCGCEGLSRVDSFVTPSGDVIVNEINTMPGFTNISMYPKLWEASGMGYTELVDTLIQLAIDRHKRDQQLKTTR